MTDNDQQGQKNDRDRTSRGINPNKLLTTLILGAVLIIVFIIGYLIIDTLVSVSRPVADLPGAVGTQVQQVINPTPTIIADPQTVIRQVQNLSRLETAAYTIEKVITAESGEGPLGFLFRDKLLLIAQGQVIAGVDLGRMGSDDVRVVDTTVYITLPAAEIFVTALDNDETYVYDRQTAVLGQQINLESQARQRAEEEILNAALEDGILTLAQENAEAAIEGIVRAMGFEEVIFITSTPAPDQNLGD